MSLSYGQITITGKIISNEDSLGIPGVSVVEPGTENGVMADMDGNYTITVSDTATHLIFTFVGMLTREVAINGRNVINTSLKPVMIYERFDQTLELYANSGLFYTPYGGRIEFMIPVARTPISIESKVAYLSDFNSNTMFCANLNFYRYRFHIGMYMNGNIENSYRNIKLDNGYRMQAYSVQNKFSSYGNSFSIGVGHIEYLSSANSKTKGSYGLVTGAEKSFRKLKYLNLRYEIGLYSGLTTHEVQLEKQFRRYLVSAQYASIGSYKELTLGVGLKFYYDLPYQKRAFEYALYNQ